MAERPTILWLIIRRDVDFSDDSETSEPLELHPTQKLALDKARILKAEHDKSDPRVSGRAFLVVEVPVIWPA
jgi:hypothetical protein